MSLDKEGKNLFDLTIGDDGNPNECEDTSIDIINLDGNKLEYEFDIQKKVSDLLEAIRQDVGLEKGVGLFFNGKFLDNDKTLKSYGVQSLSVLYLKKKEPKISLTVKQHDGTVTTIQVNSNGLCQEILDELMKVAKVNNAQLLIMSFNGKELKRENKISLYEIQDGGTINVYPKLKGGIIEN